MGQIQEVDVLIAVVTKSMSNICEEVVRKVQFGQPQAGTEGAVSNLRNLISTQLQPLHLYDVQVWQL